MKSIPSLSLTPAVKNWLSKSRYPRILHIFDQACNLMNEDNEVLSIVTPRIGNGPFNLVVDQDICFSEQLCLESGVSISPIQLHLGDLIVHTANASIWKACPDWDALHARNHDIGHQLTQLQITNYLNHEGFDTYPGKSSGLRSPQGLQFPQSLVSNLSSSLTFADLHSSLLAVQKLAGRGPGLTPAGDDFLVGAIYAVWIIHPPEVARVLAQEIATTAMPLTASLSAAWLRSAGRGETGILWHVFFDALVSNDRARIAGSMKNILAVGETSGADALAGFIGVFSSWMEKNRSTYG
jgi:hypothetical protein